MATTPCRECTELQRHADHQHRPDDVPTTWWHCNHCKQHLNRYRGQGDQQCSCGAWYNAFGERLRDDWTSNQSWRDDTVDDLEGFELSQLAAEARMN